MDDVSAELTHLDTERAQPGLRDLDIRSTREVLTAIAEEDATVPAAVAAATEAITAAVEVTVDRLTRGGRLVYVGAGTPGRLGLLDAAECVPTFGTDPGLVVALMAGGSRAASAAVEGAEDDHESAERDLAAMDLQPEDVVLAVSSSGRTPYALGAAVAARGVGAATIGLSNNVGSRLSALVDVAIEVQTGPEVIAGSTRMKAGTAQKLVLNMVSTATMVRLGKTYGNLMVDLRATNTKLRARSVRIVSGATGVPDDRAAAVLDSADGEVKTAIVAISGRTDAERARQYLQLSDGRVREAMSDAQARAHDRSEHSS
ncbi:MAG: N-acetylmuramic acid 6-phosphate etherase [Ornithinimicrobium sp.]